MTRTLVAVLASVLLVGACTGGSPASAPPPTEADVVAWLDKVCGAVGGTSRALSSEPSIDLSDPAKLKAGLTEWLTTQVAAADRSLADLKAQENGPHPKAEELVGEAENGLNQVKALLADTRTKVESSNDATQVITAFTEMMTKAAAFENTGAEVRKRFDDSGLGEAAKKAAACQQLDSSSSSAPTS